MSNVRGWNPLLRAGKLGKVFLASGLRVGGRASKWRFTAGVLFAAALSLASTSSRAERSYYDVMVGNTVVSGFTAYPAASANGCANCHTSATNPGNSWNSYGNAFRARPSHTSNSGVAAAITFLNPLNSDGDSAINSVELAAGTNPGVANVAPTTTTAASTTTTTAGATTTTVRPTTTTTASTTTTTLAINGAALYTTNCSSCHGPLATSQVRGTTASRISSFISSNSSMRNSILSTNGGVPLTSAQIQAIASALATTTTTTTAGATTTTTVGTTTTTTLPPPPVASTANRIASHDRSSRRYNENCLDCHAGVLTEAPVVANATVTNPRLVGQPVAFTAHGTMLRGNLKPGRSGDDRQCQFCHRSVSVVEGPPMPQNEMNGAIRKRVDPGVCTLCHGPTTGVGAQPNSPGPQFYQIGLPQLVPLTNPLAAGKKLYGMFCAGCHNPLANSEVRGESASKIREEINDNEGGMGALRVLTTAQIQAIATALGSSGSSDDDDDD